MSAFFAIVRREIHERRQILYAAAVSALIPPLFPMFRRMSANDAADARGWSSLLISIAFAMGIAVALGAAAIVPRMTTRRIGFDLARPVPAWAIWFGTVAAATALALASAAIVWIPASLAGARVVFADLIRLPIFWRIAPFVVLLALPVLFAVVHGSTLIFRSRSPWLALDAILISACVLGVSSALSRLPARFALVPRLACMVGLTAASAAAFLAAGQASVSRGRVEIRAAHRALSAVLWGVIVSAVVLANAYAAWVVAATPRSIAASGEGFWVQPASNGSWSQISGRARGADARFLYDTANGRFVRAQTVEWRGPAFSRDGRRAAWVEARDGRGPDTIRMLRLDDPAARPVVTRLLLDTYPSLLVLADDGSRLATWEEGALSVHDLDAQRTLASAKVPAGDRESLGGVFVGRDRFRLFRTADMSIDIIELDAAARSLSTRGRIATSVSLRYMVPNPSGTRLLTVEGPFGVVRLYEGSNGSLLASLAETAADSRWPLFLPDGRIIVSELVSKVRRLRVFGPDGAEARAIELPAATSLSIGGEFEMGRLCLGFGDASHRYTSWVANLDDGSLRKIADELRPLSLGRNAPETGSEATKLFYGPGQSSLVRLDPSTGGRRVLLGQR